MSLWERFKRLTVWNKLAALSALASIVAFPFAIAPVAGEGKKQGDPSAQPVFLDQQTFGNTSPAVIHTGTGNVDIDIDQRNPMEIDAARKLLVKEIRENMWAANEHVGLCITLLEAPLWPQSILAESLTGVRERIRERPFRNEAYLAAKTKEELIVEEAWNSVESFYGHIDEGIARVGRGQLDALQDALAMEAPGKELYCLALEQWMATVEGNYHVLNVLGQVALEALQGPDRTNEALASLKYLPLCSAEAGEEAVSVRLRKRCEGSEAIDAPIVSLFCAQLRLQIDRLDTDEVEDYFPLASQAREMDCAEEASFAYDKVIDLFPNDTVSIAYARTGKDQLAHPQRYKGLRGLFVTDFASRSAGRDAGLRVGDVIIGYDGRPIDTYEDIGVALEKATAREVELLFIRSGTALRTSLPKGTLGVEYRGF